MKTTKQARRGRRTPVRRVSMIALAATLGSTAAVAQQDRPTLPGTFDPRPNLDVQVPSRTTALGPRRLAPSGAPLPESLIDLPVFEQGLVGLDQEGELGVLVEIERERRRGIDTEKLPLLPEAKDEREREKTPEEKVPELGDLAGRVEFEFFDVDSGRSFGYVVDRVALARYSRTVSAEIEQNTRREKPADDIERRLEDAVGKSWSNAHDSRSRRGVADGYPDTHSIYQSLADYGGCSATVLSADSTRMVAITAAHCVFTAGNNFSTAKLRPRRDGGTSPSWGSWRAVGFGFYPQYVNNDCEDAWSGSDCIKHDIALVIARPDEGASPPRTMGWGYRPKSFLDGHVKYRRGYPGCGHPHSPANCSGNTLYGDGALSVGEFSKLDGDNWNRQIRFSSDLNPGDSGSGLYYYRDGFPYVFAVTSAEPSGCKTTCASSRPNYARRITPQFFDFINTVVD